MLEYRYIYVIRMFQQPCLLRLLDLIMPVSKTLLEDLLRPEKQVKRLVENVNWLAQHGCMDTESGMSDR